MSNKAPRLRTLLALSASALTLSAISAPAHAQETEAFQIEELVVTAEKREQALQDVPVAISAYTSQQRDIRGMTNIQDFVNFTPGMNYSGTDRISLRGAGRNTFYIGNDPGVASYTDGFYSASSSELFKSSLFVERTEILRGPQGTLYGRNAMGGAVNTISKRPSHDFGGEIRAGYANYERTKIEGAVSIPVAENLRFKIGGSQDWQRDGFIKNEGAANDAGTIKRTYFEIQGEAELGDNLNIWARYGRSNWDDAMGVGDRLVNQITPYDTTRFFQPIGGLVPNGQFGALTPNPGVQDPYKMSTNRDGYGQLRGNHLFTTTISYDLGWAELKYIGGFQQYNYQTGGDYDGTNRTGSYAAGPLNTQVFSDLTTDFNEHKKYYSNEINLTSNNDGPLKWIVGLYQYKEQYRQRIQLGSPLQAQLATPSFYYGSINGQAPGVTSLAAAGLSATNPSRNFADNQAELESKAWAVFGQSTYKFSDQWALTAGLRYTKDEKDGFESQRLVLFNPTGAFGAAAVDVSSDMDPTKPGVQNYRNLSDSWSAVTGTLNLDWTPDDDTLVYAKYSRGYKSGGFLLGTLAAKPTADEESVNAYELGMKKTIGGRLILNAAAFYNDFEGLQLNLSQLNAAGTAASNNFVNVDAEAYGLELEATWQPIQPLQISASYGYLHTEITKGCCFYDPADPSALKSTARPSGGTAVNNNVLFRFQDLAGSKIYQSPENKFALNANYTFDFAPGSLILSGTYTWTDETTYQPFDNADFAVPAYGTADLRVLWKDAGDRYSLIGYVKNVTDEEGFTSTSSTNPTAVFANPNVGLEVNGTTYLRQTSTAITRGLIQPRTYGVELQYRF
ncbi:MAG: TonB-dependent receptor [Phenylobacterium sp.]|uniref:TonB-dependent receptor n=1 Tax=Phenylobacterium sp. TaxID=1871053 RepID=UPI00271D4AD6|nr:TonB-dependent receptor [Phenylobacterium sp.]MDO9430893.1 TonB-dependent receptor [Phenylobacterium sp.]